MIFFFSCINSKWQVFLSGYSYFWFRVSLEHKAPYISINHWRRLQSIHSGSSAESHLHGRPENIAFAYRARRLHSANLSTVYTIGDVFNRMIIFEGVFL